MPLTLTRPRPGFLIEAASSPDSGGTAKRGGRSGQLGKTGQILSGEAAGARQPLLWKGERIGTMLRSKRRSRPLYISPGHRVSPGEAVVWVERCLAGYRLPDYFRAQARLAPVFGAIDRRGDGAGGDNLPAMGLRPIAGHDRILAVAAGLQRLHVVGDSRSSPE